MSDSHEPSLTDAQVRQVLARATEIEASRADVMSLATVRAIGAESSIDPAALEAALDERMGVPVRTTDRSDLAPRSAAPAYRYRVGFQRSVTWLLAWQRSVVLSLPLMYVFWQWTRLPASLAVPLAIGAALGGTVLAFMLSRWAPILRSRGFVALVGAIAGTCLGSMALTLFVLTVVLTALDATAMRVIGYWWQGLLLSAMLGALGLQLAVTRVSSEPRS